MSRSSKASGRAAGPTLLALLVSAAPLFSQATSDEARAARDDAGAARDEAGAKPLIDPVSRSFLFPSRLDFASPRDAGLEFEDRRFPNRSGKKLRGWLIGPATAEHTVLCCMGNTGNLSNMLGYARALVSKDLRVFLFEYQGFGQSEGIASVMSLLGDAYAAFDYLVESEGVAAKKLGVFGISLGSILALTVAVKRGAGAVALEGVFLPSEMIAKVRQGLERDTTAKLILTTVERLLLPSVDPLATVKDLRAPLLLLHGDRDRLLPPAGTVRLAEAAPGPRRVWILEDTGHAPESLELHDAEYGAQLGGFFLSALGGTFRDDPRVELLPPVAAEAPNRLRFELGERRALQVTVRDEAGKFHFLRPWLDAGTHELPLEGIDKPDWAVALPITRVETSPEGPQGTWKEKLSALARSRRHYRDFRRNLLELGPDGYVRRQVGPRVFLLPSYEAETRARILALIPPAEEIHPHLRPRFARVLGTLRPSVATAAEEEELLERLPAYLPPVPRLHYELDDAAFTLGFRDLHVAEALYSLARRRLSAAKLEEARKLLDLYLDILPEKLHARLTRQDVKKLRLEAKL